MGLGRARSKLVTKKLSCRKDIESHPTRIQTVLEKKTQRFLKKKLFHVTYRYVKHIIYFRHSVENASLVSCRDTPVENVSYYGW